MKFYHNDEAIKTLNFPVTEVGDQSLLTEVSAVSLDSDGYTVNVEKRADADDKYFVLAGNVPGGLFIDGSHARQVLSPPIDKKGWGEGRTGPIIDVRGIGGGPPRLRREKTETILVTAKITAKESIKTKGRIKITESIEAKGSIKALETIDTKGRIYEKQTVFIQAGPNREDIKLKKQEAHIKGQTAEMKERIDERKKEILKDALAEFLRDDE